MKDSTSTQTLDVSTVAPAADPRVTHEESDTIDLYSASAGEPSATDDKSVPFTHPITLISPDGTKTLTHALFDDGAMTGAMSLATFNTVKHELKEWKPSTRKLRMANGSIVQSEATWTGTINISDVEATGSFEVFNSAGGWSFLLGKPLLRAFRATHDYATDDVTIADKNTTVTLKNHFLRNSLLAHAGAAYAIVDAESNKKEHDIFTRKTNPFAPL